MHVPDTGHMSQNLWVQRRGGGGVPDQDAPPAGFPPEGQLEGTFREHGFKI